MVHVYNPSAYPRQETKTVKVFEKWLLYLVILSIAGISLYWYLTNRGKEFEIKIIAKSGAVEYRENGKEAWKEVDKLPFEVKTAYEIRTLGDSGANFSVGDGSSVVLGNFTRMVLARNQGEVDWVQSDGDTHHRVVSNPARKAYKVSVSDGEFSTSGNAFEVKIRESDTSVLVLDGQVNAAYKDKTAASAKAGEKIMISPVGKRVIPIEEQELKDVWTLANLENDQKDNLSVDAEILKLAGLSLGESNTAINTEEKAGATEGSPANQESQNSENQSTSSDEQSKIALEAKSSDKGVLLTWNTPQGQWNSWKVLKGDQEDLAYPNDSYRTLGRDAKSYLWEISDNQKYFFRICAWSDEGKCVAYSNAAAAAAGSSPQTTSETSEVTSSTSTKTSTGQTQTSANSDQSKGGATTRGKCEGSGGHWLGGDKVCKCPPSENFETSSGRCRKK